MSLTLLQVSSEDRSALWALVTFHGGSCQLNLNKKCTHLIVPEPKGVSTADAPSSSVARAQEARGLVR